MRNPYELENLDSAALQKLLRVLDDIKRRYELSDKGREWFAMGEYTTAGMTKNEFLFFINNLISRGYMEGHYDFTQYLKIGDPFHKFHEEVSREIAKRKVLQKTGKFKPTSTKPHYDPVNKILWVKGIKIKIIKYQQETIQEIILKFIFLDNANDLDKIFEYSPDVFGEHEFIKQNSWTTFRNAFRELNKKIYEQSNGTVDNFFKFGASDSGKFWINPDFL